ncbi:DUF4276 family protein [Pigmentiphaga sp. GD03639]|uniref:DUF4276 family protein n=1 Tax=Pigmentiphaga sp. GD03639 TaxID=2975354 RepID=UPI00244B4275|nr:DUF4276 family protein [Pigmentiphaga sp. GD03639]MDH2240007.1 DUF4276 family protein [Pigmentiphaga sp. GD03639]
MLEKLVVFVEEYSMEVALEQLLPKLLGDIEFQIIRFQCKNDLLKQAPNRLKGYAAWLPKNWRLLILLDRDDDDCIALKSELENIAATSGLRTKTAEGNGQNFQVITRIAIEELEAWFFGDWQAIQKAYPRVSATVSQKAGFRDPDAIAGGTWEAMERVLKKAGYFSTGLRKVELARSVAIHMDCEKNRSRSFQAFTEAVTAAMA